ncbi:MAG: pyruvate kinase [Fibrobacterota bacterium]
MSNCLRKTKILATLGPASSSPTMIERLVKAGMDAARLNFSHGSYADHTRRLRLVRQIATKLGKPLAVLQDLQGPKIRVGNFKNGQVQIKKGAEFTLTTRSIAGDASGVSTVYKGLPHDVKPGEWIYINDGLIKLRVKRVSGKDVLTTVVVGGTVSDHKGINLPGTQVSAPALSAKDREDLVFGLKQGVDYVALSFVRRPEDVRQVKRMIARAGKKSQVIAKIEKPEAVANIDAILDEADGIMVARGDLGVEMSPEAVPAVQKQLIKLAQKRRKLVITATQMLESMTQNPFPTRAEASDVANAVYDGTDAIMLSAETASGHYPVEAVAMMHKIAYSAECAGLHRHEAYFVNESEDSHERALTEAALYACEEINGKGILVFTRSGRTALLVSKDKRDLPILALTPAQGIMNRMALYWGVVPGFLPFTPSTDKMIASGLKGALKSRVFKKGDTVIILAGDSFHAGSTNLLKIETV